MSGFNLGFALVALAAVLWGTSGVSSKALFAVSDANAVSVAFFRLAIAAPVFVAAGWLALGRNLFRVAPRDLARMAGVGAALAFFQFAYFAAVGLAGVALATLVTICAAPILVVLHAVVLGRERPGGPLLLALGLALGGAALLVGLEGADLSAGAARGVLLALASAAGYAVITVAGRGLAGRHHPAQINAAAFGAGALLLWAFAGGSLVWNYPPQGWGLLLYLGLIPSALGYALFMAGMRTTPASAASVLTLVEPLTATLLAHLLFGESLGAGGWAGGALLLAAMVVLGRAR